MDLFSLVARLMLDKSGYEQGLGEAASEAKTFGEKLKGGLGTAAKVGAAAIAAIGTAATAAGAAMIKSAGEVAAYGDNIDKASQKLGISAEAYQEWDAVLQHSGTSIDSMGMGMKTLATQAAKGSEAFTALGISQKKAASMSREDLFAETITALQNVTDENRRAQLAQELFGRSAMELGPLLNTSAADTQAMRDRVHELGGVMSNEAVKAAAAYQDNLQDLQTAIQGTKRGIVSEFLPGMSAVMDGLTRLLSGEGDADKYISNGIEWISQAFEKTVDKLSGIFEKIIPALVQAVTKGLPSLIRAGSSIIKAVSDAVIQNLPELVKAGLEIVVMLAQSIAESLPEMIPTIVDIVLQIVDILTEPDTLANLVEAALQIIIALADGLIRAVPRLLEKAPVIVMNLVEAILKMAPKVLEAGVKLIGSLASGIVKNAVAAIKAVGNIGKQIWEAFTGIGKSAVNWGKDLIDNFTAGIKAFINKPLDAISGLASKIKKFLGFSEPEEGPLSDFHTYAPDMVKLFAQGIEDNQGLITDAISGAFALPGMAQTNGGQAAGKEITVPRGGGPVAVGESTMVIDRIAFARLIYRLYNEEAARVGVQLAGVNA